MRGLVGFIWSLESLGLLREIRILSEPLVLTRVSETATSLTPRPCKPKISHGHQERGCLSSGCDIRVQFSHPIAWLLPVSPLPQDLKMIKIGEILSWISERTVPPSSPSLENKIITQKNGEERQLHCRKGCFYADTIKLDEFSPVHIKHSLLMTTPSCRTCSLSSSCSAGTVLGRSQISPSIIFFFLLIYSPCRKKMRTQLIISNSSF